MSVLASTFTEAAGPGLSTVLSLNIGRLASPPPACMKCQVGGGRMPASSVSEKPPAPGRLRRSPNDTLFFGRIHAYRARPHSSLGDQTPAVCAGTITATGSAAPLDMGFLSPPVAQPAPNRATDTVVALIAAESRLSANHIQFRLLLPKCYISRLESRLPKCVILITPQ